MEGYWTCPDCGTQILETLIDNPAIVAMHRDWHTDYMSKRLQHAIHEALDKLYS